MKILITGGHLTPALGFIDYALKQVPQPEFVFIGRLHSKNNKAQKSQEKNEIAKRNVPFIPFNSGKFGTGNILTRINQSFLLLLGILKAFGIIGKHHPDVVLSFGGYLAFPLTLAAWLWRVPVVTHEQTHAAGLANKLISRISTKVAVSHQSSLRYFPSQKTVLTGNIVRPVVLQNVLEAPSWFTNTSKKPLLYITGGSQGSEILNATVAQSIRQIVKTWVVIHQCGTATSKRNYQQELARVRQRLPKTSRNDYIIQEWVSETELAWIYSTATGMVSRAGANTVEEITHRKLPSILIPLPFSHNEEQLVNAKSLSQKQAAILLLQKNLNPQSLKKALEKLLEKNTQMKRKLRGISVLKNGEKKLFKIVAELAEQ